MFTERRLGFADVALLSIPTSERLAAQRDGDSTRRRQHFDLHARLSEPLAEWYAAAEQLGPGRVFHSFPEQLDIATQVPPRPDRSDVNLLDGLLDELPPLMH